MKYIKFLSVILVAMTIAACSTAPQISQGSVVKVEYKGTTKGGDVFDSTEGKPPLSFLVGSGQVIPAFESNITKMKPGQSRKFTIKAKDAYGEADPEKVVTLPRDGRFKNLDLQEGSTIFANNKTEDGRVIQKPMKVVKLEKEQVTLDFNHQLAGQDLTFEVKLLEVQEPKSQATAQGEPETQPEAAS